MYGLVLLTNETLVLSC